MTGSEDKVVRSPGLQSPVTLFKCQSTLGLLVQIIKNKFTSKRGNVLTQITKRLRDIYLQVI
jgi:hypothetical protein